jgi:POT family proton-dependent oligopeptide transporter
LVAYFLGRPILLRGVGLPPEKPNAAFAFKLLLGLAVATALLVGAYKGVESLAFEESEDGTAVLARPLLLWGLLGGIAAWAVIGIAWFVKIQDPEYRKPTLALFIICFFAIFFFYAFEQAGSSMNLFAEQRTATDTFAGFQDSPPFQWLLKEDGSYPSSWFQSVNPLYILLFAPVFAGLWGWLRRRGLEPSTAMKMVFGLFLLGSGFVFMMLAGYSTDGGRSLAEGEAPARVGPHWLLLAYMMHTFGELCLSPVGLSLVTKLAAERYVSLMMGVWFLSSAVAQLLAGYTAAAVKEIERGEVFAPVFGGQADFWLVFLVTSVAGGVALLALTPLMKRLMGGKG